MYLGLTKLMSLWNQLAEFRCFFVFLVQKIQISHTSQILLNENGGFHIVERGKIEVKVHILFVTGVTGGEHLIRTRLIRSST